MSFTQSKDEFDSLYGKASILEFSLVPVDGKYITNIHINNKKGDKNEEYYKWQFFYSLIYSGLYQKDYLGSEVYFPKGNKNSAPIKLDGAIFDDIAWIDHYKKYRDGKDQAALDWLRSHLAGVIEFKKEDGKDIETVYNQQLKPAIKESELDFCLGVLYDSERLYLFQKRNGKYLRLDEFHNAKGENSSTKDLSLHLTDGYYKIPSFEQVQKKIINIKIDRSKRTIDDLDIISGIYSRQLKDGISSIVRVMDKVGMKNQRGYEILIKSWLLKFMTRKEVQD
jgi:type I restriction enzyme M protein